MKYRIEKMVSFYYEVEAESEDEALRTFWNQEAELEPIDTDENVEATEMKD